MLISMICSPVSVNGEESKDTQALDPLFARFMAVLQNWSPNEDRDPRNYENCLGLFLARQGLEFENQPQEIFEAFALWSDEYFKDILQSSDTGSDVRKLVTALSQSRTSEYFYYLQIIFDDAFKREFQILIDRPISQDTRRSIRIRWLAASKFARTKAMQDLFYLVSDGGDAPMEWLLELLDLQLLKSIKTV